MSVSVSCLYQTLFFLLWGNVSDCCHEGMVIKGKFANRISKKDAKSYLCVTNIPFLFYQNIIIFMKKSTREKTILLENCLYIIRFAVNASC